MTAPSVSSCVQHDGWREQWILTPSDPDISQAVRQDRFGVAPFRSSDWPVSGLMPPVPCGVQTLIVDGLPRQLIRVDGRCLGSFADDRHARWCWLGGLTPRDAGASRLEQAQDVFVQIELALGLAGLTWRDVVRTWYFNHDILDWYEGFNQVRTEAFRRHGVFDRVVPASTGVGLANTHGSALCVDLLAIAPRDGAVRIREVASSMQCPAPAYGSSFSRAVEITDPAGRLLSISGTASIAPDGASLHRGDLEAQIEHTLEVVETILSSVAMGWCDAVRGIAYFRRQEDLLRWSACCRRRGVSLPVLCTQAVICREDLLFELELDAWRPS